MRRRKSHAVGFRAAGAEAGDTLVIKFLELTVNGDQGVGTYAPGFGALSRSSYTPMLNPDLPERIWYYPIDNATNTATFKTAAVSPRQLFLKSSTFTAVSSP